MTELVNCKLLYIQDCMDKNMALSYKCQLEPNTHRIKYLTETFTKNTTFRFVLNSNESCHCTEHENV